MKRDWCIRSEWAELIIRHAQPRKGEYRSCAVILAVGAASEVRIACSILNEMAQLGMPVRGCLPGGEAHPVVDEAGSIGEKLPPEGVNRCHAAARGGTGLLTG